MRKLLGMLLALIMVLGLSACSEKPDKEGNAASVETQSFTLKGLSCEVPSTWKKTDAEDDTTYFYVDANDTHAFLMVQFQDFDSSVMDESVQDGFLSGIADTVSDFSVLQQDLTKTSSNIPYAYAKVKGRLDDVASKMDFSLFDVEEGFVCIGFLKADSFDGDFSSEYKNIINSVKIEKATAPVQTEEQAKLEPKQDEAPANNAHTETIGQKNALNKAKSYLDFQAFSHKGLVEQLQYEGFSAEESQYGADNCGADWNEQAAKKAQSCLDFTSFSRSGLIEQLVYEGFTNEQAEYGVQAVGY